MGVAGAYYLKNRNATAGNFVLISIAGTLFFDLITGVLMGPLLYDQARLEAFLGQIPFTLRHLFGNIAFAAALAPWFYHVVMNNPQWSLSFRPKST